MVELLEDFPPHVVAYQASGAVSKEEYRQIVMTRVDEVADKYGKINFLVVLKTDMDNYSMGSFLDYIKISFKHFKRWNRMAIISDQKWVRKAYDTLSLLVFGEIKAYELKDYESAKLWVSAT